ncbi:methyl-accepting chemotaxis protein [Cohnella laeviribosi]|uniref:methyl-accepting chemotaxis protein n=1 Tax=Cohnella laeviribosi TaxID=380174 RepID=UPI0004780ED5|nr:methyl-accepting chemotaxis protein [Cohnella laeviribosi]
MTAREKKNPAQSGKYRKVLKNVKMTSLLVLMLVLTVVSFGYIAISALNNMTAFRSDMKDLYKNNMLQSLELKHLETEFYIVRLQMSNLLLSEQYNEDAAKTVETHTSAIVSVLDTYRKYHMSANERALFDEVDKNYRLYLEQADRYIDKLKSKVAIDQEERQKLPGYANAAQENIDKLVALQAETAKKVIDQTEGTYRKAKSRFIGFALGAGILYILLMIVLTRLMRRSMAQINHVLSRLSEYDFTVGLETEGKNEFVQMNKSLAAVIGNMKKALAEVKGNSHEITAQSQGLAAVSEEMSASYQELATTMQHVAEGATSQAEDLSHIADALSQLTSSIEHVYHELQSVKDETEEAEHKAHIGKEEMDRLVKSIDEIKQAFEIVVGKVEMLTHSVKEISGITDIISDIANQTNLLALNAAIEAARAGETGRGFAVVADEVRKLAEQSRRNADQILTVVESIHKDTDEVIRTSKTVEASVMEQTKSVENTVRSFGDILASIENIAPLMKKTYSAMDEIVKSKDIVMERVEQVSAVTQENSATTEEVAASTEQLTASSQEVASTAQSLSEIAAGMMDTVNRFKL